MCIFQQYLICGISFKEKHILLTIPDNSIYNDFRLSQSEAYKIAKQYESKITDQALRSDPKPPDSKFEISKLIRLKCITIYKYRKRYIIEFLSKLFKIITVPFEKYFCLFC